MFKGLFFIIFVINIRTSSCVLESLYEAGQQVWKLYMIIDNRELDISSYANTTEHLSDDSLIREVEKQIDEIHDRLDELEEFMGPKKLLDSIESWQLHALIIRDIDVIEIFVQHIDNNYKRFYQYRDENPLSYVSLEDLGNDFIQTLLADIRTIRRFSYGEKMKSNEEDLVAAIAGFARARGEEICGTSQIISNILIQLFRMIIIAELKTSTLSAYENIYRYVHREDRRERRKINSLERKELEEQFTLYVNIFSLNIAVVDVVYNRACDPRQGKWLRDESFYELEKNVQPILFGYNSYKCRYESCKTITTENVSRCELKLYGKTFGTSPDYAIDECARLGHIQACVLNSGPYRFQYVNSTKLGFLGRNNSCPKDNGQVIETSITPPGGYAACQCNFWSSQNKISLLPIKSDVRSNRVITGLRFVRKNRVLYIQMREGELGPNGYINESSQSWIDILENSNSFVNQPINKENRVFFLDDLILPPGFVLTGVEFKKVTRGHITGFAIEISGTLFDYRTGKLDLVRNFRPLRQGFSEESGKRLSFTPVSSIFTTLTHIVTPSDTKYVSLEPSRLEEDFGQSTLPLFDGVPITIGVPSALGGVGIFHKGVEGYAGLISLRVYGIQYGERFNDFKLSHIINDRVLFNSSFH